VEERELWNVCFEMHCLQRLMLIGIASFLDVSYPVLVEIAAVVSAFHSVFVTAAVVASG